MEMVSISAFFSSSKTSRSGTFRIQATNHPFITEKTKADVNGEAPNTVKGLN